MPVGAGEVVGVGLEEAVEGVERGVVVAAGRQAKGRNETARTTTSARDREILFDIMYRSSVYPYI